MKTKKKMWGWLLALWCMAVSVSAAGWEDVRVNARFLTDRMAFELNLSPGQYNHLYEINYDFLSNIHGYLGAMARHEAYAMNAYYRCLDERNDELRWVLSNRLYARFMAIECFFRPVCAMNNHCYLRVYQVYTDHHHVHYGRPHHYLTYHGEHCRRHYGQMGYYERCAPRGFRRTMYTGHYRCGAEHRHHDFHPHRPEPPHAGVVRPGQGHRPQTFPQHRPQSRPEQRPSQHRPEQRPQGRPEHRPQVRPQQRPQSDRRPDVRKNIPQRSKNERKAEDSSRRYLRDM